MKRDADLFYFDSFDAELTPSYYWHSYVISTACKSNDINFDLEIQPTVNGQRNLSLFLHEYIHYLQFIGTPWGIPVFTDLTLSFFKIGASKLDCLDKLIPNFKFEDYSGLLKDGLILRNEVKDRVNKNDSCKDLQSQSNDFSIDLFWSSDKVEFNTNRLRCSIGSKIIREHMAHMGTQLFLNLSDEEIHVYNEKISKIFTGKIEYWCLFEYFFFRYQNIKNIARGIFYICQHCLSDLSPSEALSRFIGWFEANPIKSHPNLDLFDLYLDWLGKTRESLRISESIATSIYNTIKISDLINKHKSDNDLFHLSNNLLNYCIKNYAPYLIGSMLFDYAFDFTSFPLWKSKILHHGTCLVRYNDCTKIHGTSGHCKLMEDSFYYLMSANNVLDKLENNRIAMCPFQEDIPICISSDKDLNCDRNPFLHHNPASEKQCLFRNGVILLGLEDRLPFIDKFSIK